MGTGVDYAARCQRVYQEAPLELAEQAKSELARREFRSFVPHAWPVIERTQEFHGGWHIDCISDHLQAVAEGSVKRLLINLPPRHMKSILTTVMFPAWLWLDTPAKRVMNGSYAQSLAVRDCLKSRRIITSDRYQRMKRPVAEGGPTWELSSDENLKSRYSNDQTGERNAFSVDGALTGDGGDIVIVDDAHNVKSISPKTLASTREWWTDSMPTRLNNPATGAFIVIMQRVHERDLSGVILEGLEDYVHLCLPARYEGANRMVTFVGGWADPRKKKDEPLWPNHYGDAELTALEKTMSAYARAGQLQQRPSPKGGGTFKRADFQLVDNFDESQIARSARYWDKAGTDDDGDYTAGVLVHELRNGSFVIADVARGQWSLAKREARMKSVSVQDFKALGKRYEIAYEQEPGSGGKDSAAMTKDNLMYDGKGESRKRSELKGATITIDKVTGSKELRAEPYGVLVENHAVLVLRRSWTDAFLDEHEAFPAGGNDDQVDGASGAIARLSAKKKRAGGW